MSFSLGWRLVSSDDVFQLVTEHRAFFGLERLVDITTLDITGIPVFLCIRPRGRLLSVSAGKGLTEIDSLVSAAMEAIEHDVAESLPISVAQSYSYTDLPAQSRCNFNNLPLLSYSFFNVDERLHWVEAYELHTGLPKFLPYEYLSLNCEHHLNCLSRFPWGTNGLASSVNRHEAILSALYEVIERDTIHCWSAYRSNARKQPQFSIDLNSIPFSSTRELVEKLISKSLDVYIVYLRNELSIPVYKCHILNRVDPARSTASGYGCHHLHEVAINRAITEAVQGRTGYISGSREDMFKSRFNKSDYGYAKNHFDAYLNEAFDDSSFNFPFSTTDSINSITTSFASLGWDLPIVYDYPNAGPFAVVKVFCPSLAPVSFSDMTVTSDRLKQFKPVFSTYQSFVLSLCDDLK